MRLRFALLCLVAAAACNSVDKLLEGDVKPDVRLSISLQAGTVTVPRGSSQSLVATVVRSGDVSGTPAVTVEGGPAGISATVEDASARGDTTTMRITLKATTDAALGDYPLTVRARLAPSKDASVALFLSVTEAASYKLTLSQSSVTLIRGGMASVALKAARTNFSAPISVSLENAAGVSLSPTTVALTDSASLVLIASSSASVGTMNATLRAKANGLPDQLLPISIVVSADPLQLIAPQSVSLAQGGSVTLPVIVNRADASLAATLSPVTIPLGLTTEFSTVAANGQATVTLRAAPTLAAGTHRLVLRAAAGTAESSAEITVTVLAASVTISANPAALSLLPGGPSAATNVTIARQSFTGPVALSAEGMPSGVTATADVIAAASTSAVVGFSASASAAPGTYAVTIRATPVGFPSSASRTVALSVTVLTPPSGGGNVTLDWSACAVPQWVAFQDGAGAWTQATLVGGVARFTVNSERGGIAFVGAGPKTTVQFMTKAELTARALDMCPAPTGKKTITGTGVHLTISDVYNYRLGGASASSITAQPNFVLSGVRDGTHDFIAWGGSTFGQPRGLILRDQNLPDGASLGTVDVNGQFSFVPVRATLAIAGGALTGDNFSHTMSYLTREACTENHLYTTAPNSGFANLIGIPLPEQRETDYHMLTAVAAGPSRSRSVTMVMHALTNAAVTFPTMFAAPTVTSLAGSYKRLQFGLGVISGIYDRRITARYNEGARTMIVSATPGYLGTTDPTLAMPDLSGVSGWPLDAAIASDAHGNWTLTMDGGGSAPLCTEGRRSIQSTMNGVF